MQRTLVTRTRTARSTARSSRSAVVHALTEYSNRKKGSNIRQKKRFANIRLIRFTLTCKYACHSDMKQNLYVQISDEIGQSAKNSFDNYDRMLFEFQINVWSTFPKENVRHEQVCREWQNAPLGHRDLFHVILNFTQEAIFRQFFISHTGYLPLLFQWCCGCVWTGQEPGSRITERS